MVLPHDNDHRGAAVAISKRCPCRIAFSHDKNYKKRLTHFYPINSPFLQAYVCTH